MDLAALEIFKAVVDHGGVNRAAERLHRVPSNVTTRIKQLEEKLGTQLFIRDGRRLALSAEGQVLLGYANRLLQLSAEARAAVCGGPPRGKMTIGSLESTAAARLPAVLAKYHALYPEVELELVTGTSGALVSRLHERAIEAAFVAEPFNAAGLMSQLAFVEEIVLITAKGGDPIRPPKGMRDVTLIAFANGCSYRRRLEAWLRAGKVHADRIIEFQSYHAIIACVAAGTGIAVVPRSVLELTAAGAEVKVIRLPAAVARARTQLVWRPSHHSTALEALKKLVVLRSVAKRAGDRSKDAR
jgi:DNA-binding transcriptional LysR family regulator